MQYWLSGEALGVLSVILLGRRRLRFIDRSGPLHVGVRGIILLVRVGAAAVFPGFDFGAGAVTIIIRHRRRAESIATWASFPLALVGSLGDVRALRLRSMTCRFTELGF